MYSILKVIIIYFIFTFSFQVLKNDNINNVNLENELRIYSSNIVKIIKSVKILFKDENNKIEKNEDNKTT